MASPVGLAIIKYWMKLFYGGTALDIISMAVFSSCLFAWTPFPNRLTWQ